MERLLKGPQEAERLSVAKSTIEKWVHFGFIPHVKIGRSVRFRAEEIEKWLIDKTRKGRLTLAPEIPWE